MVLETTRCLKTAATLFCQRRLVKELSRLSAHGAAGGGLHARRRLTVSRCLAAKVPPPRKPRERVDIPGLELVTYGERMHFVPGLAKPVSPHWERDYKDPRFFRSPPAQDMPLYKDKPCYVFSQRTGMLEGDVLFNCYTDCS